VLDSSYEGLDTIIISAGKIGHQVEISPMDLIRLIHCKTESITVK
jgi:Cys-tRNA(Pro)/Cys-tRNA(Cys) deacylase